MYTIRKVLVLLWAVCSFILMRTALTLEVVALWEVRCLWPVPDVFQLKINWAEVQVCFVCTR